MMYTATLFLSAIYLLLKQMQPYTFYQKSLQQKSRHISHRIKFRQKDYTEIENDLLQYKGNSIQLSPETNYTLYQAASTSASIIKQPSPNTFTESRKK